MQNDKSNIKNFIKSEFSGWSHFEVSFLLLAVIAVSIASFYKEDSGFALTSAVFGIIYTVMAGKGRVSCYFFGVVGTLCCAYISYKIALYGNFALHLGYYFPMEIIGFFTWRKNLQKTTNEIIKSQLSSKERVIITLLTIAATIMAYVFFKKIGDMCPFVDASMTVLSLLGMYLTVKRDIEQWLVWTLVNILSVIMWFNAFSQGEHIFAILIVRIIYFFLGIYFFVNWKKQIANRC
ncbi:MAG: nicotinamide riboside transporter PnuC [Candidatus Gastranaerophilales bacterium]|nr:nicotinamide riboside transporter PnuC [Candidatus Gastranaerophilales bacterium]